MKKKNPRILIVTPEVTYLPPGMGYALDNLSAKTGGLADVSAALIGALFELGADVHVAIPDYRSVFNSHASAFQREYKIIREKMPDDRVHFAEDRAFFYQKRVYSQSDSENIKISLAFQREVINNILPQVQPDLIHCNDWMTGLIPSMSRQLQIPCLLTIHNIFTVNTTMAYIEDRGIDAASFWKQLYFVDFPSSYEYMRDTHRVDFLTSGVFASHFVNTVSPTFIKEIVDNVHTFIEPHLQREIANKWYSECGVGILNSPDPSFNPKKDDYLKYKYDVDSFQFGKASNKQFLQRNFNLIQDPDAPLFFWPSRLDTIQKGCQLFADILFDVVDKYRSKNLQIIFVADGVFQKYFREIVEIHDLQDRVAVCHFDERIARYAYAASDFILMPSRFEPCGLPQMIAPLYGSLPVVHDTGGIHDTISHLNVEQDTGNGFLFKYFDSKGLSWAIDQAMDFFMLPNDIKVRNIKRIMKQSAETFNHSVTAKKYMNLYEKMLQRPLINTP
jgi:starch synthase/alpha-amylase